jgi:hypothetical protein
MIRYRSMPMQVVLTLLTFGIYPFYWFYSVGYELKDAVRDEKASPVLWTILLFVPLVHFYSWYKFAELYERWSPDKFNRWILFVLFPVFVPAVWFIVQTELNRAASRTPASPPTPVLP